MEDRITVEVLDDGTIKVVTDDLSGPNHMNADELLGFLGKLMGGEVKEQKKPHAVHSHSQPQRAQH